MAREMVGASARIAAPLCSVLLLLVAPRLSAGATIVVPDDQPTVQAAVTAAAAGDTVLVRAGTYAESVRIGDGRHRVTLAAADKYAPPILVAADGTHDVGILVDRVDDVTIQNLVLRGAAEGVRVDHAYGAVLTGLRVEGAGVAVRLRRGGHNGVLASEIVGTRLGEGIRVEWSPEVLIRNVTIDQTRRDGILVRRSRGARIAETTVSHAQARHGIMVIGSPNTALVSCTSGRNQGDGIRVRSSVELELRRNDADDNGRVGVHLDRCSPFASVGDVVAAGNRASANARRDVVVTRPNCRHHRCGRPTTPQPPGPTPTTVTTTTAVVPTSTPTTTHATPTTVPLPLTRWRLYVRVAQQDQGAHDVNVPARSSDAPLEIDIPTNLAIGFRIGDQVTVAELAALGGDTLQRFDDAATAYIATHVSDYPGFTGLESVNWVMRVSGPE